MSSPQITRRAKTPTSRSRSASESDLDSLAPERSQQDLEQDARNIVLRKLNYAPRTRSELATDLVAGGIPESIREQVLDRYVEVGLIDDAALAELWVTSRQRTKGSTRSVLKHELRQKGVSDEDAEAALALITEADEYERARRLIATKIRATERLTPKARTRRLMGLLMRRGYSANLAQVVVQEALGDCEESHVGPISAELP